MGTLGEVRRRPGKESQGEGVVGKRREERKRVKEHLEEEGEDEVTEVESKVKRTKRRRVVDEDDASGGRGKGAKPAKRREQKKPGIKHKCET